jgi:5-methylcytosine-specific restriction protein A
MPTRALSVCSTPGCPELTTGGRCVDCKRTADRARGSGGARGYTRRWATFSPRYLAGHPVCECKAQWCEHVHQSGQCGAASTDPDHIDGTGRNGPRAFDDSNLIALCRSCHARKTVHEDGGFGR